MAQGFPEIKNTKVYLEFKREIRRIIDKYNLELFDSHAQEYLGEYNVSDYMNREHLCNIGAHKFSKDFSEWLVNNRQ